MLTNIPTTGYLRLQQVLTLIPISKTAWRAACQSGRYHKPVKLGPRTTVWKAEDNIALIERVGGQQQEAKHGR